MEALVGLALGYLGIFLAVMAAVGSAIGTGIAGEAASGVVTEEPTRFVPALVLQALPGTQGIYGFVVGFLLLGKLDVIDTVAHGWLFVLSGLPVFLGGVLSAIYQGSGSGRHQYGSQAPRGAGEGNHLRRCGGILRHPVLPRLIPVVPADLVGYKDAGVTTIT